MLSVRQGMRALGKVAERLLDNWIVDFVIGNWFDPPIEHYLDRSNRRAAGPRPRSYLDAEGNAIDPPAPQ